MKLTTIFSAIVLSTSIAMPLQALAGTAQVCDQKWGGSIGGVSSEPQWKDPLSTGDYSFSGAHKAGSSFFEELSFSLTSTSDVSIELVDVNAPVTTLNNAHSGQFDNLLSNKYLTFSLFDKAGQFLGSAGAGGTLTALDLAVGNGYVLTVSGKATGDFGGIYAGNLSIATVGEVPLGETAPLFGSALLFLVLSVKKFRTASSN